MSDKQIKDLIKREEARPLSGEEVMKIIDYKANLLTYPELTKCCKTIFEALGPYGALILLYETRPDYGHWITVFLSPRRKTIEFFDPYSYGIDDQLKYINPEFRKKSNQLYPYLTKLLYDSGYKIEYNHFPFQRLAKTVNTCGRWSALRLLFRDLPLETFIKLFKKKSNKDLIATAITIILS